MSLFNQPKKGWIYSLAFCSVLTLAGGSSLASADSETPSSGAATQPATQPNTSSQREIYVAQLTPLNVIQGSGPVTGAVRFVVEGNAVGIDLQASGLAPGTHQQHIHKGNTCPTNAADVNHDGFIDAVEANSVTGDVAFPFSLNISEIARDGSVGDLSTLAKGKFPATGSDGTLSYIASVPIGAISQALSAEQPSSSQPATPSGSSHSGGSSPMLALDNHVIEIHGVDAKASLPSSVQGAAGESPNETLPVACGAITKVS